MSVAPSSTPVLEIDRAIKNFSGLRPLRIASLSMMPGERVSIGGIEAGAGEVLVNLVTGASLPDEGEVRVFGRRTADIADSEQWLDSLEQFGIVSPRGVLLEESTVEQNLAMPFTLAIDPVPLDVVDQVRRLAAQCGIDPDRWLAVRAGELPHDVRVRTHLARSLALNPAFLVIEHPTASVEPTARSRLASDVGRALAERHVTALVLTNDDGFAKMVAARNLKLNAATGALKPLAKGWFGR